MRDGKSSKDKGYSLRDWFKGGGWKQTGGRDPDDRAAMSKDERDKRAAKKRREDPNPDRTGKAKIVTQEETKKDACYKKVKASAKVWPSAYASGRLVQCRKKGAANWGNKSESYDFSNWRDDFKATEYEFIDLIKPEPLVSEGSFDINPKAHRQAQREKKIRDRTKTGDEGSEIAKKKVKGPSLMGEEQIDESGKKCWKGYKKVGNQKLFGKTYNRCVKANEEFVDEAKDDTEIGFTGKPIPKKNWKSPKKRYEFEKKRREAGFTSKGPKYRSDVNPYYNPRTRVEENEIGEAKHTPTKSDLESNIGGG
jgi:hypothetical protein